MHEKNTCISVTIIIASVLCVYPSVCGQKEQCPTLQTAPQDLLSKTNNNLFYIDGHFAAYAYNRLPIITAFLSITSLKLIKWLTFPKRGEMRLLLIPKLSYSHVVRS